MRRISAAVSVNPMLSTIFSLHILLLCFSPWFCSARDNITWGNQLRDHDGETLVSSGGIYELGFFTPNGGSDSKRYIGIWHRRSSPQTVVWVANRDKPISDTSGVFAIAKDGNLMLLDAHNQSYWKTSLTVSLPFDRMVKLMDSGNLVLSGEDQKYLWQSFDNPTDTFLSGMNMNDSMVLTSWKSNNDPAPGDYMFRQDEEGYGILTSKFNRYWQSSVSGNFISSDEVALLSAILSSQYNESRLVMNSTGKIQFYIWKNTTSLWDLQWFEPRNRCSVYNACGNFGSCNSNTRSLCKCLPGFEPNSPENWRSGDFSEGCIRKSNKCSKDVRNDTFLNLKMMKVSKPDDQFEVKDETECQNACLKCNCQAYSFSPLPRQGGYNKKIISRPNCWIWSNDLRNLWENFTGGRDLHVRVSPSDIGLKNSNCEACGTNIIPYPLSTTQNCSDYPTYHNCGDPRYSSFNCCIDTGQLSFKTSNGYYTVTNINPESQTFTIQIQDTHSCKEGASVGKLLQLNKSLPFYVSKGCNEEDIDSNLEPSFKDRGLKEVDIGWTLPLEPYCTTSRDCIDWPNTTCNTARDDKQSRCRCNAFFQWDGLSLNCTPETGDSKPHGGPPHKQKLLDLFLGIISAVIVISGVVCVLYYFIRIRRIAANRRESRGSVQGNQAFRLYDSERRVKDFINSGQFREDDKKGIDVPFFYLESILAATDNFSDSNKLGQGGFGLVYKGTFPGGQEIAIKRLSNGSGQGLEEFKNEVVLIAKLQHRNLVRLLGYCVDWDEKMLLYEYMPNKSLDSFIFGKAPKPEFFNIFQCMDILLLGLLKWCSQMETTLQDRTLCVLLNWEIRFNIIMGIVRGLLYLHQDSRLRIIHRDLKTSNVLLDEEMNPKISDFGLARIVGGKQTEATTNRIVGTYGYMSPEYALDGFFSIKSDVFSFGVVILEIISGKRNTGFYQSEKTLSLLGYTWRLWKEDKAMDLMDQTLRESGNATEFLRCVNVGLLCVQEDPSDRPTMSTVLFMLGNETATVPNPKQPPIVVRRPLSNTASSSNKLEVNAELTASLEQGR